MRMKHYYVWLLVAMVITGGVRMRLDAHRNATLVADRPSKRSISEIVESKFKKGKTSALDVQETMGAVGEYDVHSLGKNDRDKPKNSHRDVVKKLSKYSNHAELYSAKIKVWDIINSKQYEDDAYFLLPYEELDCQFKSVPTSELTKTDAGTALQRTVAEWRSRVGIDESSEVVGLGVWGDTSPFNTRDNLLLVLWNVITGIHHHRFWFCAVAKSKLCRCGCFGKCTVESIWNVLKWALGVQLSGKYPTVRHDSVPFAASKKIGDQRRARLAASGKELLLKGGCIQKRGDWSWYKSMLNMTGWKGEGPASRVCWKCNASSGLSPYPFTDATLAATWRKTMIGHRLYVHLSMLQGTFISGIFSFPGFVLDYVSIDLMHTGDLGILQIVEGCVLFELFQSMGGLVSKPGSVLGDLLLLVSCASKALGQPRPPVNKLTLGMIEPSGKPPRFKVKASEARYMLPVLVFILEHYFPLKTPYETLRFDCLRNLNKFYDELLNWQPGISGNAAARFGRVHVTLFAELGKIALASGSHKTEGWVMYRFTPKHHLFIHLIEEQIKICDNPRDHWCYADESSIGDAVSVAESVHANFIHTSVMTKHRL